MKKAVIAIAIAIAAPTLMAIGPARIANADTCSGPYLTIQNQEGANILASASLPEVTVTKTAGATEFCESRVKNNIYTIHEYNDTGLCLNVNGAYVIIGSCSGSGAQWNEITDTPYSGDVLLENVANLDCADQYGTAPTWVDYSPCQKQSGVTDDEWKLIAH
jgi:hypothetical protein